MPRCNDAPVLAGATWRERGGGGGSIFFTAVVVRALRVPTGPFILIDQSQKVTAMKKNSREQHAPNAAATGLARLWPATRHAPALLAAATAACRACRVRRCHHHVCCINVSGGVAAVLGGWLAAGGQEERTQEPAVQAVEAAAGWEWRGGEGSRGLPSTANPTGMPAVLGRSFRGSTAKGDAGASRGRRPVLTGGGRRQVVAGSGSLA